MGEWLFWLNLLVDVGIFVLLAASLNLINGHAGMFHLGHHGFWALGAYAATVVVLQCGAMMSGPVLFVVSLGVSTKADSETVKVLAKDLAMHVASEAPLAIDKSGVDQAVIDNEKDIFIAQAKEQGKPDNVIEWVEQDGKTYVVVNDYTKLRELLGRMLREVQRIKSEGDFEARDPES